MNDIRFALRQLLKSPGFTAIAVLMLALGIGLSTSSFSMANAFLLRNVPYPDADRLVRVFGTSRQTQTGGLAPGYAIELRETATSFSAVALYNGDNYSLGEPGQPAEQVYGMAATANFFDLLGVQPFLGRGFTAGEDQPDKPTVVVLTYRAWVRRYASDPGVIGRTIRINTQPYTIIGVLPATFEALIVWGPAEFVMPRIVEASFRTNFTDRWMQAVGRLKPGASLRSAQAELSTLAARFEQAHPKENKDRGLRVVDLAQSNMDSVSRSLLWLMTGIALAMLLIACANLASLQVARALVRGREFAIRAALGGGRRQLMVPLLVESVVLALIGGGGSLLVASWSNDIIGSMLLIGNQPGYAIPLDGRVFAFAAFSSLLSGVAFGLAPAWLASRAPAAEALKEGARGATAGRSHQRLKRVLIVLELALALALVGVAGAFGVGARIFVYRQVGWNMDGLFTGYLALPYNPYGDNVRSGQFYRMLQPKLAAIPGVQHAAISTNLPMYALGPSVPLLIEGQPVEEVTRRPLAQVGTVTSDFFAALQIPLKQGAIFSANITEKDPAAAVVNEAFARRFWPEGSAVGRRVRLGDNEQWIEIVGVVGDVGMLARMTALDTPLQLYRPLAQNLSRYVGLVLRTSVTPESLIKSVREAVATLDADLPVAQAGSLRSLYDRNLTNLNLVIVNLAVSAGMGLLIAAVGLFGVISQLTAQRTRDIGVRIALGAGRGDILRLILGEGARLMVIGVVIGIPGYYALTVVLRQAMPAMALPGLWLLAVNVAVLAGAMLLACYLPAARATRISPIEALRTE
ncbi:MAG TPA: ABC transporter permease [Opitutaceae bacterium]|nr:ABC transporter permease [Opitutaceae bacterium]